MGRSRGRDDLRYALSSARFLQQRGAQLLVVACNTQRRWALDELRRGADDPLVGVGSSRGLRRGGRMQENTETGNQGTGNGGEVLVLATQGRRFESHAVCAGLRGLGLKPPRRPARCWCAGWRRDGLAKERPAGGSGRTMRRVPAVTAQVAAASSGGPLARRPRAARCWLGCTHDPLLRLAIERTLAESLAVSASRHRLAQATGACLWRGLLTENGECKQWSGANLALHAQLC